MKTNYCTMIVLLLSTKQLDQIKFSQQERYEN